MNHEAWQVGSKSPPTVCLCCGMKFDESKRRMRGPYLTSPYLYVCQVCWENHYLFFPDKDPQTTIIEKSKRVLGHSER